jgi:transcriptional regulator with XRE-family HTH domain
MSIHDGRIINIQGGFIMNYAVPELRVIGQRLRKLRNNKKQTIREASAAMHIGKSALSNYEAGLQMPRDKVKVILADYYDVDICDLFFTL